MDIQEILAQKLGNKLFFNEPLSRHSTFKIGGPARFFYLATSQEELIQAIQLARELKIRYCVLGGGSNVLFSDEGFWGLVIKNQFSSIEIKEVLGKGAHIIVSSGTPTALVLNRALEENWTGLEFLDGIPGTIGGAVVANAHAYFLGNLYNTPRTIFQHIHKMTVLTPQGDLAEIDPSKYEWKTNGSNISTTGDIVVRVCLDVVKGVSLKAKQYLADYMEFRKEKPYSRYPTAGSIFKNYILKKDETISIKDIDADRLEKISKQLKNGIIPAGWAIDVCSLLGHKIGDAQIWPKHGNFIVNLGQATAKDVIALINLCKKTVYDNLGIQLQEEVRIIN